jgi:hypothetical protein
MCVCLLVCVCVCTCVCVCVCLCVCVRIHVCSCVYSVGVWVRALFLSARMCVYMCACSIGDEYLARDMNGRIH